MPTAQPDAKPANTVNQQPQLECDIVMKGGISSGVVYPLAVCELSRNYRFRGIGGTSAGAIAAAATAAAEFGRANGVDAFSKLEELPAWLGKTEPGNRRSNLLTLFQPQRKTKPLFELIIAGLDGRKGKSWRLLKTALSQFPVYAAAGAAPGFILAALLLSATSGLALVYGLVSAFLLASVGVAGALAIALKKQFSHTIPDNAYGLCRGGRAKPGAGPAQLTNWLADQIDLYAGRSDSEKPLTFGDLWGNRKDGAREIDLQMMTTNLNLGRPFQLPFEENAFYFDPESFRDLFPEKVVRWMESNPRPTEDPDQFAPLRPLPDAADLPVVFGTRLSLSFPLLISAVPLYAIDYSRKNEADRSPQRCWFSDGGICSNFPVHFFDGLLPRRPTFGVNLRPFHADFPPSDNQAENIYMPRTNSGGVSEWWHHFDHLQGAGRLFGFIGTILSAMQNWTDNTQLRAPGYRDRVVHISLSEEEGGLNLDMPPEAISALAERGRQAGIELVRRFGTKPEDDVELTWDNHRWVRYRSTLCVIEDVLERLEKGWSADPGAFRTYADLAARSRKEPPSSYRWRNKRQQEQADTLLRALLQVLEAHEAVDATAADGAPKPRPELRVMPRT